MPTASSRSVASRTASTGPKSSSLAARASGFTPVRTVGSTNEPPWQWGTSRRSLPPHATLAPSATAASMAVATRSAAWAVMRGPTSVAGSRGSPSRRRPALSTIRPTSSSTTEGSTTSLLVEVQR